MGTDGADDGDVGSIVRPYVVTGGRTRARVDLALETLIETTQRGRAMRSPTLVHPEQRLVLDLCDWRLHSVAEMSAHLKLPLGVARVLIADMAHERLVTLHAPIAATGPRAIQMMERVLGGLRRL